MLRSYLYTLYLRYLIIILGALEIFYVGMDFLANASKLPDSANLQSLYAMYTAGTALRITLPVSLIFAMIATKIHMIRANEMVIVYALGVSKATALRPFVVISFMLTLIYIIAMATPFAYFEHKALSIKKNRYFVSVTNDVFVKYNESYLYIKELFPLQKSALGLRIFETHDGELTRVVLAKSAIFKEDRWTLLDVTIRTLPEVKGLQKEGLINEHVDSLVTLRGFKPEILESVHEGGSRYSLLDAVRTLWLFKDQEINMDKVLAVLVSTIAVPLFAPIFMIVIFFTVPISSRFFNIALFSSFAIFATLLVWGFLFAMSMLAQNGTVNVWFGVVLPLLFLALFSLYTYRKNA